MTSIPNGIADRYDQGSLDTNLAKHELRVVKNVTISMDETTLTWVRVEAARAGVSVSRWLADDLERRRRLTDEKAAAIARIQKFLETPLFDLSENGKITIDRDKLYDDGRFDRFDDPTLHSGPAIPRQTAAGSGVGEQSAGFEPDCGKPSELE